MYSTTTMSNLAGRRSANVQVGRIVSNHPRRYELKCIKCNSNWTASHESITRRIDSGLSLECRLDACRLGRLEQESRSREQERNLREREKQEREDEQERLLRERYAPKTPAPTPKPKPRRPEDSYSDAMFDCLRLGIQVGNTLDLLSLDEWCALTNEGRQNVLNCIDTVARERGLR